MINSSSSQQSSPQLELDNEQKFERVLISTPLQQKQYTNISFKQAQKIAINQLQTLVGSTFYSHFNVYMGAENQANRSYIEQKYKREEEILKLKIEQTKKNIFSLSRANDEQEFDHVMKNYMKSMKAIASRSQDVDNVDFIPVIYIDAHKKRPFFAQINQQFDRKGAGSVKVNVGLRTPFSKLDCLQFKAETPLSNFRRKYFTFDLEWKNSHEKYGNYFTKLSHSNSALFKDIDEKSHSFNVGLRKRQENISFEWQNKLRYPSIHKRYDEYVMKSYHLPSFKSSLKATKVWQDTVQFNDVNMGKYLQTKAQATLPFISKAQFAKVELNYRKFYDLIGFKNSFDNQLMRKLISGSGVETNFSWNMMKPFMNKYVSDVSDNLEVRGFEQPKVPVPTFSNLKLSAKFNLHNYPLIGQARLTPFLYTQAGFSLLDMTHEKEKIGTQVTKLYGLGSVGIGIGYYLNKFAQIELVYSLAGYQNLAKRQPTGFQIRIGVFD